jgi:hypothetical protein
MNFSLLAVAGGNGLVDRDHRFLGRGELAEVHPHDRAVLVPGVPVAALTAIRDDLADVTDLAAIMASSRPIGRARPTDLTPDQARARGPHVLDGRTCVRMPPATSGQPGVEGVRRQRGSREQPAQRDAGRRIMSWVYPDAVRPR